MYRLHIAYIQYVCTVCKYSVYIQYVYAVCIFDIGMTRLASSIWQFALVVVFQT